MTTEIGRIQGVKGEVPLSRRKDDISAKHWSFQSGTSMSKGSKAVCMRFPEPHMGTLEAEAAAQGISVPELCRRIIVEGLQAAEKESATEQVTSIPTRSADDVPNSRPRFETPASSSVRPSQKVEVAIGAATSSQVLADLRSKFPELSPPSEAQVLARKSLANLAQKRPEAFDKLIMDMIAKGMTGPELVKFMADLLS